MRVYPALFETVLRRMDPELAHHLGFQVVQTAPRLGSQLRERCAPSPQLAVRAMGIDFPSPFGIAAGFDKNATGILGLGALGFGHVEVGTLTKHAQEGNPRPRMFRLVDDGALINRMGFNNEGSAAAIPRIERARMQEHVPVIGVNIGKSRITPVDDAVSDYVWSTERLAPIADYLAINVSSPNTPGLRGLQELTMLRPLLSAVRNAARGTPVVVKIAPDMDDAQLDGIVDLAVEVGLAGIVATNTTVSRSGLATSRERLDEIGPGGLSGRPLRDRSLQVLQRIREVAPSDFCVVSVGGVSTPKDVLDRLLAGATLVQGYTAFVYKGPLWAKHMNAGLLRAGWHGNA